MRWTAAAFVVVTAATLGCATTSNPTELLADSQAATRAADELGAGEHPEAALYLKLAQEQIDAAKVAIKDKKFEEATALLNRAGADAELAMELSKSIEARREADRLSEEVASLRAAP
ncbi:MAG: DUF4398 domain-containing protein [Deltaproteobacteria bacterium]|nr:DUF4398 domain-containing protein [Deltaproteobacteria bacterium]